MLKFIHIKDTHFRFGLKAPISRKQDEFEKDIDDKLEQIIKIAKKESVDFITISGDVFDIKLEARYSLKVIDTIYKKLKRLRDSTKLKKIYTIAGNHDLPYSSRDFKSQSIYNVMVRMKILKDIHKKPVYFKDERVKLIGLDYNKSIPDLLKELKELHKSLKKKDVNILLFHEHLIPHKDFNGNVFIKAKMSYKRVLEDYPKIDIFLAGHYHKGYTTYKKGKRYILNGWNLTRLARDYYTLNNEHKPEINIVKIDNGTIDVDRRFLKVRDFTQAINLKNLDKEVESFKEISNFIKSISTVSTLSKEVGKDVKLNKRQKKILEDLIEVVKNENS